MSRKFGTYEVISYQGGVFSRPINLCKPVNNPRAMSLQIDWGLYPKGGVAINGSGNGVALPMELIAGIYIDNQDCSNAVYVQFPDTDFVVTCADYSSGFFPVMTNGLDANVYVAQPDIAAANLQSTRIHLCNVPISPFSSDEFNQTIPVQRASGQNNYATPTVADRISSGPWLYANGVNGSLGGLTATLPVVGAIAGTRILVTGFDFSVVNPVLYYPDAGQKIGAPPRLTLKSGTTILYQGYHVHNPPNLAVNHWGGFNQQVDIYSKTGLQFDCDGSIPLNLEVFWTSSPSPYANDYNVAFIQLNYNISYARIIL